MRVMTVLGTRPEIIRLSRIIPLLDLHAEHTLVHTGQNYAGCLSDVFFSELGVRAPDHYLGVRATRFGEQIGQILTRIEPLLVSVKPERLLILGDTNSGLAAIVAKRLGIQVLHMEAGNRCFDDRVPEEVNRRIIDHSSTVLLPYTQRSMENLVAEGIERRRIFVTGNPIKQVIDHHSSQIRNSTALVDQGVEPGKFFLVTTHRAENVDHEDRLRHLVDALEQLHHSYGHPVVCSLHPRTRSRVESFGVDLERGGLHFVEPLGFFDFVRLEQEAFCILSDSGTVQEEACLLRKPNVTIRDVTERPETIECGSNILSGADPEAIARCVALVTGRAAEWEPPREYLMKNVAETVVQIVLGYRLPDRGEAEWMGA